VLTPPESFRRSYTIGVLALFLDLFQHQAHADASLINAIRRHEPAARDDELRRILHHILVAHRFWIHLSQGLSFSVDDERKVPDSLDRLVERYRETQVLERDWLTRLEESDLARTLESTYLPGRRVAVSEALLQVCLHSQGHRSQCATRLRALGGEPPAMDFILWLKDRPAAEWPEVASAP
jgi:uncharacterized damage-inducible protein DinB